MVRGIGVDVVDIARMEAAAPTLDSSFALRVFTDRERGEAALRARPAEYLAGRFAAKEAVYKALNGMVDGALSLPQIEVLGDETGRPHVVSPLPEGLSVLVSISHDAGLACAFAVAQESLPDD